MNQITRISCLTPAGTGAIATVALHGPNAWSLLREVFLPASKRPLSASCPETGTVIFGRLGQEFADEVIVAVMQSSPEPWLDIHCHGGSQVVAWMMELCVGQGATRYDWPELLRATQNRLESLASENLANAGTLRTAAILLDQLQGAMRQALNQIQLHLQAGNGNAASAAIQAILRFTKLGPHLTAPWKVVVAGPPNAGKSSLVNALAGFQRSIVTPIPGTTRDAVSTFLAIDGWPVELIDTAGIHSGAVGLENEGIVLAREQIGACDLCLGLMDVTVPQIPPDERLVASGPTYLLVANKIDQTARWTPSAACAVSALTGEGLTALCHQMSRHLVPDVPAPGAAVPFGFEVSTALLAMHQAIADGKIASALAMCKSWL
jgi:tRNA modification GTPase